MNKTARVLLYPLALLTPATVMAASRKRPPEDLSGYSAINDKRQTVAFCGKRDHRIGVHHTVTRDIGDLYYLQERSVGQDGMMLTSKKGALPSFSRSWAGVYSTTDDRSGEVYIALVNEYCSPISRAVIMRFLKSNAEHFSAEDGPLEGCHAVTHRDGYYGPEGTEGLLCRRENKLLFVTMRSETTEDYSSHILTEIASAYYRSFDKNKDRTKPAKCLRKGMKTLCRPLPDRR